MKKNNYIQDIILYYSPKGWVTLWEIANQSIIKLYIIQNFALWSITNQSHYLRKLYIIQCRITPYYYSNLPLKYKIAFKNSDRDPLSSSLKQSGRKHVQSSNGWLRRIRRSPHHVHHKGLISNLVQIFYCSRRFYFSKGRETQFWPLTTLNSSPWAYKGLEIKEKESKIFVIDGWSIIINFQFQNSIVTLFFLKQTNFLKCQSWFLTGWVTLRLTTNYFHYLKKLYIIYYMITSCYPNL